jgi:hypothetical protein
MLTNHNLQQKRTRLEREICEWTGRLLMHRTRETSATKRNYTNALRCLRRCVDDLAKLNATEAADSNGKPKSARQVGTAQRSLRKRGGAPSGRSQ